jgi:hypothetical protein
MLLLWAYATAAFYATYAAADAAAGAAIVGDAAAEAATATFAAAYAAGDAAFYAAYAADAAEAAKKQNQKETAEICRKYIGQLIIDKCNELNTKEK